MNCTFVNLVVRHVLGSMRKREPKLSSLIVCDATDLNKATLTFSPKKMYCLNELAPPSVIIKIEGENLALAEYYSSKVFGLLGS